MINVKALIDEGVLGKPSNIWPTYPDGVSLDRTKYVTSSEIGYCERKIYYDKQAMIKSGYSPKQGTSMKDVNGWGVLERGHNIEAWVIETLNRGNASIGEYTLTFTGAFQRSFVDGYQSGTPDGVFLLPDHKFITLEIKSIDPRTNTEKLPKAAHLPQVMQNMDLVAVALDKEPIGAILVYFDASDYSSSYQFDIPYEIKEADKLIERAERIMTAENAAELNPEGIYADHCKYCSHKAACNAVTGAKLSNPERGQGNGNDKGNSIREAAAKLFGQS